MSRRALILSIAVAVILGGGIYYLMTLKRHIAPTAASAMRSDQTARTQLNEAALQPSEGQTQIITLYFPSYTNGNLLSETRSLKLSSDNIKAIRSGQPLNEAKTVAETEQKHQENLSRELLATLAGVAPAAAAPSKP